MDSVCSWVKFRRAERHFWDACEEIRRIDKQDEEMQRRLDIASRNDATSMLFNLTLRQEALRDMRTMFIEFANKMAHRAEVLRRKILEEESIRVTGEALIMTQADFDDGGHMEGTRG